MSLTSAVGAGPAEPDAGAEGGALPDEADADDAEDGEAITRLEDVLVWLCLSDSLEGEEHSHEHPS